MPSRPTYGPRRAEKSRSTSETRTAQREAAWPISALELQRSAGNRATAALLGAAHIQRDEQSAALLTKLATPQIKPGPAVDVQKSLVKKLDVDHANDFAGGIINLGGILIDELPETDEELIQDAELVELPTGGKFISAGSPRAGKVKELGFDRLVVENTLSTMIDSKEVEYLRLAGLPNKDWKILIEVHYYRERDMSATGFHKDTLGETLFVNLNYHMDKKVIGPEYVVNPQVSEAHEAQIEQSLPASFREDLEVTRGKLGDATEYGTGMVDPYGYVAFVDEAVHHATPFYGQRWVTGSDLKWYLEEKYPAAYKEATTAYPKYANRPMWHYPWGFSSYVDKSVISAANSNKWLAWMQIVADDANANKHFTRNDLKAMPAAEFDDMLEVVGAEANADKPVKRTQSGRTQGAAAGFQSASIPGAGLQAIRPDGKPVLKRRLSDPNFRKQLPPEPEATEKRRFFRTWIRVIPKAKADDLRRRLREAK
jgi:hypothetical protein